MATFAFSMVQRATVSPLHNEHGCPGWKLTHGMLVARYSFSSESAQLSNYTCQPAAGCNPAHPTQRTVVPTAAPLPPPRLRRRSPSRWRASASAPPPGARSSRSQWTHRAAPPAHGRTSVAGAQRGGETQGYQPAQVCTAKDRGSAAGREVNQRPADSHPPASVKAHPPPPASHAPACCGGAAGCPAWSAPAGAPSAPLPPATCRRWWARSTPARRQQGQAAVNTLAHWCPLILRVRRLHLRRNPPVRAEEP